MDLNDLPNANFPRIAAGNKKSKVLDPQSNKIGHVEDARVAHQSFKQPTCAAQ